MTGLKKLRGKFG